MTVLIGLLGLALTIVIVIISILNHRIKMRMIKDGHVDENSIKILSQQNDGFKLDSLKWGIILLFGGTGLIILEYLPQRNFDYCNSTLPFGVETVCLAFGFLVYYIIARAQKKSD